MNNEDYWKKRAEEREAEWTKKSKDTIEKELADYYRQALSHITDDIAILYGRYAKDNNLTYAETSKLLTGKEFKQWRMSLEEYLDAIDKTADNKLLLELNTLAMRKRISRLDKLYSDTLKNLYKLGVDSENSMTKFLSGAYKDNYYKNLFDIGKTIGIRSSVSEVDDKKVRKVLNASWSGKNYSERIWKNTDQLAKLIRNEITDGFHRGVSINKMAKLVQQRMNVGKYEATRLVRTEMNYVQNQAALDSIKDSDMKYYIFLATLDKKTSTVCRAHDRKVYPVDGATPGTNMPPLHPHCRSTIAGNLTDYDTGRGKRSARDKNGKRIIIPAAMKYDDYYKIYIEESMSFSEWEKAKKNDIIKTDDKMFPEELAGAKRGKPMNREKANKGRVNPNYKKGGGYTINCQTCVVAFEARLRGYDVQALPNLKHSKLEELSIHTNLAWIDKETGKHPDYIRDNNIKNAKQCYDFLEATIEEDKRYTIEFAWKGRGNGGHIVCIDKDEDGKLRLYDPQIGRTYTPNEIKKYLRNIKYAITIYGQKLPFPPKLLRIDDKQFDLDMVNAILEAVKDE